MKSISISDLINNYNNKPINLIDIRDSYNYNLGHIYNSRNIPMYSLICNPSKFLSINETYYIYCQSGNRSKNVVNKLNSLGYDTINVDGGYNLYLLMK